MDLFSDEALEESRKKRKKFVAPAWTELWMVIVVIVVLVFFIISAVFGVGRPNTPSTEPVTSDVPVPAYSFPETSTTSSTISVTSTSLESSTTTSTTTPVGWVASWDFSGEPFILAPADENFLNSLQLPVSYATKPQVIVSIYTQNTAWSFLLSGPEGIVTVNAIWDSTSSSWVATSVA